MHSEFRDPRRSHVAPVFTGTVIDDRLTPKCRGAWRKNNGLHHENAGNRGLVEAGFGGYWGLEQRLFRRIIGEITRNILKIKIKIPGIRLCRLFLSAASPSGRAISSLKGSLPQGFKCRRPAQPVSMPTGFPCRSGTVKPSSRWAFRNRWAQLIKGIFGFLRNFVRVCRIPGYGAKKDLPGELAQPAAGRGSSQRFSLMQTVSRVTAFDPSRGLEDYGHEQQKERDLSISWRIDRFRSRQQSASSANLHCISGGSMARGNRHSAACPLLDSQANPASAQRSGSCAALVRCHYPQRLFSQTRPSPRRDAPAPGK